MCIIVHTIIYLMPHPLLPTQNSISTAWAGLEDVV